MLPDITSFEDVVTLVSHSGIQFLDFGLTLDPVKEPAGEFVYLNSARQSLARLRLDPKDDALFYRTGPSEVQYVRTPQLDMPMAQSLAMLDRTWLPLPALRFRPPQRFDNGPGNWARMRIAALDTPDLHGHTHRLTLAFDTRTMPRLEHTAYLSPVDEDVHAGASFRIATDTPQTDWFTQQTWVSEWLTELFHDANSRMDHRDRSEALNSGEHIAHYLNLLSLLHTNDDLEQSHVRLPEFRVIAQSEAPIPVDFVLDVGNSRTCGIMIEDHGQSGAGLQHNYTLQLRDMLDPERIYTQPFESRVEFSQTFFGKDHLSIKSGRHDAFLWPTIARVGIEAGRLASRRSGTEGSTGLSSPKRYLWDTTSYDHGWRFNSAYVHSETEPLATAAPFSNLINELGDALYALPEDQQMPVFKPHYSRSSLMTFMLSEVLTQALMQINSPAQRMLQGHTQRPRQMRSITMTVPPAMPQAERSLLESRMRQSIALVWKSLGWHTGDEEDNPFDESQATQLIVPTPQLRIEWDEASCGQMVYLYTEVQEKFASHPEEFFRTLARPGRPSDELIRLATIDIGGGTTDLVINDYTLDRRNASSTGSNVRIDPSQRFRDGFRVAGDDILLDVIQQFILPSFHEALKQAGVESPDAMMAQLCGQDGTNAQKRVLRQQLNLQVFVPLGLSLLAAYESFDPEHPEPATTQSYGQRLKEHTVTEAVVRYVEDAVRREVGHGARFDLRDILLHTSLDDVHRAILSGQFNICKTLDALAEVTFQYHCDMLLLTGRPSRLPGIQAYIRQLQPVPPGRILPMHNYHTGGWYPFHRNGKIQDPKSTASVGAMLCQMAAKSDLPRFFFNAGHLRPYSTMRHIGLIDHNNNIPDADVIYRDIQTSDDGSAIELPEVDEHGERISFKMPGPLNLGFRQLSSERWAASPLYTLGYSDRGHDKLAKTPYVPVLTVTLAVDERASKGSLISDQLKVDHVESDTGDSFSARDLCLQLNTLNDAGLGDTSYWLDNGSVKRT